MTTGSQPGRLVSIDGASHSGITAAARAQLARSPRKQRAAISWWDASGVFEELAIGSRQAGTASLRTLLLLYAADLAFRLRWEIRPMLDEGRTVIAAPYIDTAVAFGRAAGLPVDWVRDVFQFAPAADAAVTARRPPGQVASARGFIEVGCEHLRNGKFRGAAHVPGWIEKLLVRDARLARKP
jgi:thymidylate kinase